MSESTANCAKYADNYPKTNTILHDIRNMRSLTPMQIATIRKMTTEEKMEVIFTYDSVVENISNIVNNM